MRSEAPQVEGSEVFGDEDDEIEELNICMLDSDDDEDDYHYDL